MPETVLASIINWRRPENIHALLTRYREQTVPLHIVLVECSPDSEFAAPPEAVALADVVITINRNLTACSRFIPPLMMPQFRYTFFGVDDHLPGRRHVECLLRCAESLGGRFATIGQDGRCFRNGAIHKRRARPYPSTPRPIDVVTSSELMETRNIADAIIFRQRLREYEGSDEFITEDDLILCMALQTKLAAPCYVTPQPGEDEWWAEKRLPSDHALSGRPNHIDRRNQMIQKMTDLGWRSMVPKSESGDEGE